MQESINLAEFSSSNHAHFQKSSVFKMGFQPALRKWALSHWNTCLIRVFCVTRFLGHAVPAWPYSSYWWMWLRVNAFLLWEPGLTGAEVSHCACLHNWSPIKILGTKLGWASVSGNTLHMLSHTIAKRMKGICATPQGVDTWKLIFGFSWTSPCIPFPFTNFNLYSFAIINWKDEYNNF